MDPHELPHTVLNRPLEIVNFPRVKMVKEIGQKAYGYVEYRKFISDVGQRLYGLACEFGDLLWYHDSATEEFINRHIDELRKPAQMSVNLLAETLTYLNGIRSMDKTNVYKPNVYERELAKRADMLGKMDAVYTEEEKRAVIRAAAAAFGISFL